MRWSNRLWRDLMPEPPLTVTVRREGRTLRAEVQEFPGVVASADSMEKLQEALAQAISLRVGEPGNGAPTRVRFWQQIGEVAGDADPRHRIDVLVT